jgi:hypothetical protein
MGRQQVGGDQVKDESLTGDDILDGSVQRKDLDVVTPGEAVIRKHIIGDGLKQTSTGADDGTGDVTVAMQAGFYGCDFARDTQVGLLNISGGTFTPYSVLNFDVTDTSGVNEYRLNIDFLWGHNSASNDARFQMVLDGNAIGEELRIEPKDPNSDQRFQNNILVYANNLAAGSHTLELTARPASASRITRIFRSTSEVWRVV